MKERTERNGKDRDKPRTSLTTTTRGGRLVSNVCSEVDINDNPLHRYIILKIIKFTLIYCKLLTKKKTFYVAKLDNSLLVGYLFGNRPGADMTSFS